MTSSVRFHIVSRYATEEVWENIIPRPLAYVKKEKNATVCMKVLHPFYNISIGQNEKYFIVPLKKFTNSHEKIQNLCLPVQFRDNAW